MTDPARTPDPERIVAGLPPGAAVIFRVFGASDALSVASRLRALTHRRGLLLLIGADPQLAARAKADGLHLPERMIDRLPRLRAQRPQWILTAAAHSGRAVRLADGAGADAVLLSSIFPSRSPSAGRPIGTVHLAQLARSVKTPILALGGVDATTARRLPGTGVAGFAAVDAWSD